MRFMIIVKATKDSEAGSWSAVTIHLCVADVDAFVARVVGARAKVEDMFWGDRYCQLEDPFGHHWAVATHVRDVSPEEMQQAAQKLFG